MKRRFILKSIIALPAVAVVKPPQTTQQALTAAREKGLPVGPPLVPPGVSETPNTPVVPADEVAGNINNSLNPEQLSALRKLGELIVPSWNDIPGATEAGAAEFLDFLVGCSPKSRLDLYRNGLTALNRSAEQAFGKNFGMLDAREADRLLSPLRERWTFRSDYNDALLDFLQVAKGDLLRATLNSRPYIDALSQTRRPRNASRFYWYPIP
jgi:hypothetical protein